MNAPTHAEGPGLALFDLDHTLLPIDSDHAWGRFLAEAGWVDDAAFTRRNDAFYADYQAGTLDIDAYVAFVSTPLREHAGAEREAMRARFAREVVAPAVRAEAQALVERHRRAGDLLAIVTATNDFVTTPIAAAFGVAAADLIATRLELDARGSPTGRIAGTASFREGKVARVRQWLAQRRLALPDFARVSVYSDSANDLPLLEIATDPVATNPSPELAAIARARGWRTLELFAASP